MAHLVKAVIKPGRKAELAARLADGTLARGNPQADRLLHALRQGYALGNEVYFFVEEPPEGQAREELEHYFAIERTVPEERVDATQLDRMRRDAEALPEWAGVDR